MSGHQNPGGAADETQGLKSWATRDAGDRDFRVVVAEDGCAAMSPGGHENALAYLDKNFCHVKSTAEVIELLAAGVKVEMPVVSGVS